MRLARQNGKNAEFSMGSMRVHGQYAVRMQFAARTEREQEVWGRCGAPFAHQK